MAKELLVDLDKLQRMDHDTLVRLESKVDQFVSQYIVDMKELRDGTTHRLADHEVRLEKIERTMEELKPVELSQKVDALNLWRHDFHLIWRFVVLAAATVGGVVAWILNNLAAWIHLNK